MAHQTGPQTYREGEFIIVESEFLAAEEGMQFFFEGRLYIFGPAFEGGHSAWKVQDETGSWVRAGNIRWVQWEPATISEQLVLPESIAGRALHMLPRMKSGSSPTVFSFHSDGLRLVRTAVFLEFYGEEARAEIPLIDTDGRPWVAPEIPCMMTVRFHHSTTDRVSNPSANDIAWSDVGCSFRPGVSTVTLGITRGLIHAYLKPAADPVPHWVLRITFAGDSQTSGRDMTILVDLLGQGYGPHASSSREEGTSGTFGHWKTSLVWGQQGFNATPNHTSFNDREFAMHAVDVPNSQTATTIYLTSDSTSTGTELFGELPMCDVLGDATIGSYNTGTETSWENETWGLGVLFARTGISTSDKMYSSTVVFDSTASRFRVDILNVSGLVGSSWPGDDSTLDRSFRIYSVGKRV